MITMSEMSAIIAMTAMIAMAVIIAMTRRVKAMVNIPKMKYQEVKK